MRFLRGLGLTGAGAVVTLALAACEEDLTAPGSCPTFCPVSDLSVFDSIFRQSIVSDTTFRGYVQRWRGGVMPVVAGSGVVVSYGVVRFVEFADSLRPTGGGDLRPIVALDSFRLRIQVPRWSRMSGLELDVHRLHVGGVDSLTEFAAVEPLFADSTRIGTMIVPEDTIPGDTLALVLPGDVFPTLEDDSLRVALGLALRAPAAAFVDVATAEGGGAPVLTRFAKIELTTGETSDVSDNRSPAVDTYVFTGTPTGASDALTAGGVPAARALLRFLLPDAVVDSSNVIRATVILVPAEPVVGAPGDTLTVRADQLGADLGPKSPIVPPTVDTLGAARVAVGSTDTVRIDITHIVRPLRLDSLAPRAVMIRLTREGGTFGEFRFLPSDAVQGAPSLHVTWSPLPEQGGT